MLYRILIWVMRFVLLGMIYVFLYKVIRVMHSDIRGGRNRNDKSFSAGIEVVEVSRPCSIPKGAVYPIRSVTNLGRASDNDVVIDSEYISSHHARIYLKNNAYILKDRGSTNGTYLNDVRIERPAVINNNDRIRIGGITFKVID